jgi:Peroxiredoxin
MRGLIRMRRGRVASVVGAALIVGLALSGCANDNLAKQYASGDGKNYIAGSGVTEVKPADRGKPVEFSGKTEDGATFSSAAHRGHVVVVNFWYASCPPCRAEADDLQKASTVFEPEGVVFIGVNTRDTADSTKAFDTAFGVTYPSILDVDGGAAQLAFSGSMRPNSTPTTFVLDKQGRVAAQINGGIDVQPSTLDTLIRSALGENGS